MPWGLFWVGGWIEPAKKTPGIRTGVRDVSAAEPALRLYEYTQTNARAQTQEHPNAQTRKDAHK